MPQHLFKYGVDGIESTGHLDLFKLFVINYDIFVAMPFLN